MSKQRKLPNGADGYRPTMKNLELIAYHGPEAPGKMAKAKKLCNQLEQHFPAVAFQLTEKWGAFLDQLCIDAMFGNLTEAQKADPTIQAYITGPAKDTK